MYLARLLCLAAALWSCVVPSREVLFLTLDYPPYSSEAMPKKGAAVELLHLMLEGSGFEPKIKFMPWSRLLYEIAEGRADGALLFWPEELKKVDVLTTSPIFLSRLGFYIRSDEQRSREVRLFAMHKKRVCTVRGYGYPLELADAEVIFDEALSDEVNLQRVAIGRCDYVALEKAVGEYLLSQPKQLKLKAKVSWAEPAFAELPLTFAVTRAKSDSDALLLALESGLARLRSQQRYQQLSAEYGLDQP